jgi:hypothetical protein
LGWGLLYIAGFRPHERRCFCSPGNERHWLSCQSQNGSRSVQRIVGRERQAGQASRKPLFPFRGRWEGIEKSPTISTKCVPLKFSRSPSIEAQ